MANFFKNRLNRDNFWNLLFGLIVFLALSCGTLTPQPIGGILFSIMSISAIALVKLNSPIFFDQENKVFITSNGKKIQTVGILFIFLLGFSFFLSAALAGLITDYINGSFLLNMFLFSIFFSLIPPLYCILRNFPISIYFHKKAWTELEKLEPGDLNKNRRQDSLLSLNRLRSDPINSWHNTNIYHRK